MAEIWPPLDAELKYQKSAGFLRVARYPYGGFGCSAKLNAAFEKPKYSLFFYYKNPRVDSNVTWRTQNATGAVVKDNRFIIGLNPEAGSLEGWHLRYHGSP